MSDQDTLPAHVHPEVALLPWYVNGTLSGSDRELVDRHLAACSACRAELADLTLLRNQLTTLYNAEPAPSSRAARSVFERLGREAAVQSLLPAGKRSRLERFDAWLRSLFLPRWAPTLALILFLAQIGVFIMWIRMPMPSTEQVTTRTLGMQTATIVVSFQGTATEEQILGALRSVHGRVTDGPTADGRYTIEVPAADPSALQHKLEALRGETGVVRSADTTRP